MNRWKIPTWLEAEVIKRDTNCIHCGVELRADATERRRKPSWEHIVNDARTITREKIALCCIGCNASKGAKNLSVWLNSKYCEARSITADAVADVAKHSLRKISATLRADEDR